MMVTVQLDESIINTHRNIPMKQLLIQWITDPTVVRYL